MKWTPYAPAGLLAVWSFATALGCDLTGLWALMLILAVAVGTVELKGRYRER